MNTAEIQNGAQGVTAGGQNPPASSGSTTEIKKQEIETTTKSSVIYTFFGKEVELGSRKVIIKLVPKFSILPKDPGAKFIRDEVTKKIGSTWKKGTRDILRGLSQVEEEFYLPTIIGIRKESEQWNDRVRTYWADFFIDVPNDEKGIELEVGFQQSTKSIPNSNAEPINLDDYIKYRFATEHNDVASTPEQLDNMYIHTYYVIDKGLEIQKEQDAYKIRNIARKKFNTLIESKEASALNKIDWILETIGGDSQKGINVMSLTSLQKEMELEKTMNKDLSKFVEILDDKNLETKALIRKAVGVGLVLQDGNSYFIDSKVIGSSLKEAIGYLSNPSNQKDKLLIIERLKSYSK